MELSAQSEVVRDDLIAVDAMHQLTDQLEQSVSAGRGPSIFPSVVTALDELADSLRSDEKRIPLSRTSLPTTLVVLMRHLKTHVGDQASDLALQIGRVAANLAADCDDGRQALCSANYPHEVASLISTAPNLSLSALRSLTASLLNMTVNHYRQAVQALATWTVLCPLLTKANELADEKRTDDASWMIAEWIWTVVDIVTKTDDSLRGTVAPDDMQAISYCLNRFLPSVISKLDQIAEPLVVLVLATRCIENLAGDGFSAAACFSDSGFDLLSELARFIESAYLPADWLHPTSLPAGQAATSDDTQHPEKLMSEAKANLIRAVVQISEHLALDDTRSAAFWDEMRTWIVSGDRNRDDLLSCALLSFGNAARNDTSARRLVAGNDAILNSVVRLLDTSCPITVQHAAIGLLRNLSVLPSNRLDMIEIGVVERLFAMQLWSANHDMLGSVQGGAIGVVKNLCRDNREISKTILQEEVAVEQLCQLISRTEDEPLRWEGNRIFVNTVRALSNSPDFVLFASPRGERIVTLLCDMLKTARRHVLLVHESIISLALLSTMEEIKPVICRALVKMEGESQVEDPSTTDSALAVLLYTSTQDGTSPPEVVENAKTLVRGLAQGVSPEALVIKAAYEDAMARGATIH